MAEISSSHFDLISREHWWQPQSTSVKQVKSTPAFYGIRLSSQRCVKMPVFNIWLTGIFNMQENWIVFQLSARLVCLVSASYRPRCSKLVKMNLKRNDFVLY